MKLLFDLFPLLVFFAAFKLYDIYVATAAAILATLIQVAIFWLRHRRFETMHLVTLAILCLFGGMTIVFQNDAFIKWKPSIINWIFSLIIFGMLVFARKSALEYVMGGQLTLPPPVWRQVNIAWGLFFLFIGALNLYIAFYYNPGASAEARLETWVNFKVFGLLGLTLVFSVLQMLFIFKHIKPSRDET